MTGWLDEMQFICTLLQINQLLIVLLLQAGDALPGKTSLTCKKLRDEVV